MLFLFFVSEFERSDADPAFEDSLTRKQQRRRIAVHAVASIVGCQVVAAADDLLHLCFWSRLSTVLAIGAERVVPRKRLVLQEVAADGM